MIFSHIIENGGEYVGFKKAREKSGITQQEVATRLGIDQSAVCQWETGKTKPRASLLPKVAEIYGCTIDELLRQEEPEGDGAKSLII